MKRYFIPKEAYSGKTVPAIETLISDIVITNEVLEFKNLPYLSILLSDEDVELLKNKGYTVIKEQIFDNCLSAGNYEKIRSLWYQKPKKRLYTGKGVKIAILDTGCNNLDTIYPETRRVQFEYGYNFINSSTNVKDGNTHGTFCTSIIKNSTNNGGGTGEFLAGLAPDCEMHSLKIFTDEGSYNSTAFLGAMDYIIDNNIDFVNMSFRNNGMSEVELVAIQSAQSNGTVIVAASGNYTQPEYTDIPAALPKVIAVNAIYENGTPGYYGYLVRPVYPGDVINPGEYHGVDVACSGRNCEGRFNNGNIGNNTGTSFSSPFLCGVLACYKEQLNISDNYIVANFVLNRAVKMNNVALGRGIVTF